MFQLIYTNSFKRDVQRLVRRGYQIVLLKTVIEILEQKGNLPLNFKPHRLKGKYLNYWEAHIKSDWLIIWLLKEEKSEVWLTRTGRHADLFKE